MKSLVALCLLMCASFCLAQPPSTLADGIVWMAAPWLNQGVDFMISSGFPPGWGDPCAPWANGFGYGFCGENSLTRDIRVSFSGGTGNFSFVGVVGIATTTQLDSNCWQVRFPVTKGSLTANSVKTLTGQSIADFNATGLKAQYLQMWCSINGADRWAGGDLTVETP
jgi:hypothetical protein